MPYVLGATIGTPTDTLLVAADLETPVGIAVLSLLVALVSVLTVAALVALAPYSRSVAALDDRLVEDRRAFVAFVASLALVPLALLVVPLVL